jgi:hypothetical protein
MEIIPFFNISFHHNISWTLFFLLPPIVKWVEPVGHGIFLSIFQASPVVGPPHQQGILFITGPGYRGRTETVFFLPDMGPRY